MDQTKIWSHFQTKRLDTFNDSIPRYRVLARQCVILNKGTDGSALNIGIGSGGLEAELVGLGWKVASLDQDEGAVARVKSFGVRGVAGSAVEMPFENEEFDCVIISEVLEHIDQPDRRKVVSEIHRVLKRGAYIIGTVPNNEDLALMETVCPGCGLKFHRWGHVASFTSKSLALELEEYFKLLKCAPAVFLPRPFLRRPLFGFKQLVKWCMVNVGFGVDRIYTNILFIGQKS